jgi:hypothetical protein
MVQSRRQPEATHSKVTRGKRRSVRDRARVLGRVGAAERELAVRVVAVAPALRRKVHAEHLRRDRALVVQVVHERRNLILARHRALGQVDRTEADDAVDTGEARGSAGNADRLLADSRAPEGDGVGVLGAGDVARAVGDLERVAGGDTSGALGELGSRTDPEVGRACESNRRKFMIQCAVPIACAYRCQRSG